MLDHGAAGLLNRGTGPAAVEAGEEPAGKGSRPALPTSLRRNYIHATPILRGLGCNCNVAKPSGQRWGPRHRIFVEHEVDVHGRAVSFMAVSLVLGFLVAPEPTLEHQADGVAHRQAFVVAHFGETPHQFVGEPETDEVAGAGTRCP